VNVDGQLNEQDSLLNRIRVLISIRKENPVFSTGELNWIDEVPSAVAGYWRTHEEVSILVLNNLSDQPQQVRINLPNGYPDRPIDLLSGAALNPAKRILKVQLQPFQFRWIGLF
jgi:maltose alpha-D-glucosyltransferase/alpha-amylase